MPLEVRIERKHIEGSESRSTTECPIARALKEQHPREGVWCVWLNKAALWPGKSYDLPPVAERFMADLIAKRPVSPLTFLIYEED